MLRHEKHNGKVEDAYTKTEVIQNSIPLYNVARVQRAHLYNLCAHTRRTTGRGPAGRPGQLLARTFAYTRTRHSRTGARPIYRHFGYGRR